MDRFNLIFEFIKKVEGGYNKIPADSGGQTIFGIAEAFNQDLLLWAEIKRRWGPEIKQHERITGTSALSKCITAWVAARPDLMAEIRDCYYNRYWVASCAYSFDAPIDALLMDSYLNMGLNAKKILQEWAGIPAVCRDGIIGKQTRAAVRACQASPADLIRLRWEYYQKRPTVGTFGKGWKSRLLELAKFCKIDVKL